jgi:hypothetical protein
MSRNGSGTYTLPAGNPVVTGTTITSSWANTTMQNIADGLTQSVSSDGQTPMSGALNMATNKINNLGTPTVSTDAVTKAYADALVDGTASGSFTNLAYTGTLTGGTGVIAIGTNQIYKSAAGNVGIGTASPANKLQVISADNTQSTGIGSFYSNNGTAALLLGFDRITGTNSTPVNASLDLGTGSYPQAMHIDSSGNVKIGTTSTYGKFSVQGYNTYVGQNVSGFFYSGVTGGSVINLQDFNSSAGAGIGATTENLIFYTGTSAVLTEKARIDTGGNLLVGTTSILSAGTVSVKARAGTQAIAAQSENGSTAIAVSNTSGTANYNALVVYNNTPFGTIVGSINCSGSTTNFNTSSDYRLKENVVPMTGALEKVSALKPVTYKWKLDGSAGQGFIAHELQAVVPDCVTGEKDAVDAEGKPVHQGIDTSFLVATLTAAIQEQQALITDLTTRLSALEAK